MNRIKNNSRSLLTGISGLLIVSVLNSCGSTEGKTEEHTKAATVPATETFSLQKEKLSTVFNTPGELVSFQQVDLYARENSFVKKLHVDVGSEVKEGQLLVTMEAPELTARLAAAESRWKSQEAVFIASKANYERLLATSKTPGTISQNDLDQALARMHSDQAQLEAAKATHKEIADTRGYLAIRAPFSGVITARNVNPGAYVGPSGKGSEHPLFTLQEQKHLRLVISVPEVYTSFLQNDDAVTFRVKARPDEVFEGRIKRMAGALDNRLRSERIEIDVLNNDKKLLPGMIAEVSIPLLSRNSTFVVPKTAVVNSMERIFVIRVVNNKAEWVNVQRGREADNKVEVYGPLTPGDQLVKVASEEIRNEAEVKVVKVMLGR